MNEQPTMEAPILELCSVQKTFDRDGNKALRVLEDINLDIRPNEVVALIGPSGCGKSTILRVFAGLIQPTKGQVRYRGEQQEGLNTHVSIVFQSFALYPWKTVEGNVEMVLRAKGLGPAEIKDKTKHAIHMVGLEGFEVGLSSRTLWGDEAARRHSEGALRES